MGVVSGKAVDEMFLDKVKALIEGSHFFKNHKCPIGPDFTFDSSSIDIELIKNDVEGRGTKRHHFGHTSRCKYKNYYTINGL